MTQSNKAPRISLAVIALSAIAILGFLAMATVGLISAFSPSTFDAMRISLASKIAQLSVDELSQKARKLEEVEAAYAASQKELQETKEQVLSAKQELLAQQQQTQGLQGSIESLQAQIDDLRNNQNLEEPPVTKSKPLPAFDRLYLDLVGQLSEFSKEISKKKTTLDKELIAKAVNSSLLKTCQSFDSTPVTIACTLKDKASTKTDNIKLSLAIKHDSQKFHKNIELAEKITIEVSPGIASALQFGDSCNVTGNLVFAFDVARAGNRRPHPNEIFIVDLTSLYALMPAEYNNPSRLHIACLNDLQLAP